MSLRGAIKSGVSAAFTAVGDIKTPVVYYSATVKDPLFNYDTKTGDKIAPWNVVLSLQAILVSATKSRLIGDTDWLIKPGDQVAILQQDDLGFAMQLEDKIEINGKRWGIINFKSDPAAATFIAQIRQVSAERLMGSGATSATTGPIN